MKYRYEIRHHEFHSTLATDYAAAVRCVITAYGPNTHTGHDGDIVDGENHTLCWESALYAENDDGSRACCSIHADRI